MPRVLFLSLFVLITAMSWAQGPSRSGMPADPEDKRFLRRFPCGGTTILDETFQADTLPDGFFALDEDGFVPRQEIQFLTPTGGWQLVTDFKDQDSLNQVLASPSWYENGDGPSDDYLVLPQVTLPATPCLSWYAYSQDKGFPESYEVRVSTTTADPIGFQANPPAYTVAAESDEFTFHTLDLSAYAGQTVYLAFRHTTNDGFILALDDIRLAEVKQSDLAMFRVNEFEADPLDTIFFAGSVINRGLDTLNFDSLQMQISWQINNETVQTISIADAFALLPNDTINWRHDSSWVPQENAAYRLRVWVSGIGNDDNVENDTLSRFQAIGTATSIDRPQTARLTMHPNPATDQVHITLPPDFVGPAELRIFDLQGRLLSEAILFRSTELDLRSLPPGHLILLLSDRRGQRAQGRLWHQ